MSTHVCVCVHVSCVCVSQVTQHDDFQVVTAKCSEVNVHVLPPPEQTEDEPREHPVPEQFISTFNKEGQLITTAAAHSGA